MGVSELKKILLVEDEPDIQSVARLALESVGGFSIEVCSSGQEALDRGPAFQPDLLLLDVMMPGMDGPSTLKALREKAQTASTPVIFMTAKVQEKEVAEYISMGALAAIAKPFDPMTLSDQIKEIWAKAHA